MSTGAEAIHIRGAVDRFVVGRLIGNSAFFTLPIANFLAFFALRRNGPCCPSFFSLGRRREGGIQRQGRHVLAKALNVCLILTPANSQLSRGFRLATDRPRPTPHFRSRKVRIHGYGVRMRYGALVLPAAGSRIARSPSLGSCRPHVLYCRHF